MKAKILTGIRYRIETLEKQLQMAYDADLGHIIRDTDSKLDELYGLEEWIEGLKDD
jgi:hypothetical protein